jgi:hypothetical protein
LRAITRALSCGAIPAALVLTFALPHDAILVRGCFWGLVVLASMAGWGRLVGRIAFPDARADAGLRLAWGAAGLVAAGGVLCLLSVATPSVLFVLVCGGAFLEAVELYRRDPARCFDELRRWPAGTMVALAAMSTLIVLQYAAGAAGVHLNVNDDHIAYFVYPKEILATGTLIEPFSLRRMSAYGGHSFLHALTLLGTGNPLQLQLLEYGISTAVLVALILGAADDETPRGLWLLPVLLLLTLPDIHNNTASEVSGVVVFFCLYRTATFEGLRRRPRAGAVVLGLLAAAACTLRQSYIVSAVLFLLIFYLPAAVAGLRAAGAQRREGLAPIAVAACAGILFLLPWALLSYRSNRTFLFPILPGNYHPEYGAMRMQVAAADRIKFLWTNITYCQPIYSIPFFLVAGMLIRWRETRGALPALLIASFVGFLSIVNGFPLSDAWSISRYYYGFELASVLAVIQAAFALPWTAAAGGARTRAGRAGRAIPAVLAGVAIVAQVQESHGPLYAHYNYLMDTVSDAQTRRALVPNDASYRKLQATIPAGASLLVMVDEAFWFDFKRNHIKIIDIPGAVSPPPGMPLGDDESFVRYVNAQGYRYVAFVRPSAAKNLYRRDQWAKINREAGMEIWKLSAPFYLRMFDRVDGLMASRLRLYDDGQMVALDLDTPAKG